MSRAHTWNAIIVGLAAFWGAVIMGVAYAFAGSDVNVPPPAKYDHPYAGKMIVEYVARSELNCRKPKEPHMMTVSCVGVAVNGGSYCWAFIWRGLSPDLRAKAIRHERANCNGWNDGR